MHQDSRFYNQALEFQMTEFQSKAFKIALIWEDLTREVFPNENCGKLPKKGDPRESNLFRYCHKLLRTTNGLLLFDQYEWYIKAQLDILKDQSDRAVTPACLIGTKAWHRWKVWVKKYNNISKVGVSTIEVPDSKVIGKLKRTKEFLVNQFKKNPNLDDINQAIKSRTMLRWLTLGKVCPYYVLLSPFILKILDGKSFEDEFNFDFIIYKSHVNNAVIDCFKKEFDFEYINS
jgi:hypothetical protein